MKKELTEKDKGQLAEFIINQQQYLGGAMVMQMVDADAKEITSHVEIFNKDISDQKYLVTTIVRPLTDELKAEIFKNKD